MTLSRQKPMPRTAFKRSPSAKSNLNVRTDRKEAAEVGKVRRAMKSSRPVMTPIRKSARDEDCTLRFACCNFDPATTVWAHSNRAEHGKGAGRKARDEEGCYACSKCHSFYDGGYAGHMARDEVEAKFDIASSRSQAILRSKGLLKSEAASSVGHGATSEHDQEISNV